MRVRYLERKRIDYSVNRSSFSTRVMKPSRRSRHRGTSANARYSRANVPYTPDDCHCGRFRRRWAPLRMGFCTRRWPASCVHGFRVRVTNPTPSHENQRLKDIETFHHHELSESTFGAT